MTVLLMLSVRLKILRLELQFVELRNHVNVVSTSGKAETVFSGDRKSVAVLWYSQ